MKIVIVDRAQINVTEFQNLARKLPDCDLVGFTDPVAALDWCFANEPDLLVVDYMLPLLSSTELVEKFRARYPDIPVLMMMASDETESRLHALQIGVTDFLNKPLDHVEVLTRTKNMLALRKSHKELTKRTSWLVEEVNEAYQAMDKKDVQVRETIGLFESIVKLTETNRAKNDFLARISHDLRTPLTTILGYSDFLARDTRMAQHNGELSVIHRNAHHLLSLIDELFEFARNEIGPNRIKPIPLYFQSLIDHVIQQAEALAQESGNRAVLEQHGQMPQVVVLDPVPVRRVLFNLLANAAKFTRNGTLTLRVSAGAVDAGEAETPEHQELLFEVIDTGVGIDPAEQERIFEPFYRAVAVTGGTTGSGLGLAICRQWAQAMGGSIKVTSIPERGSCFSFRLTCPLASEADIDIADTACPPEIDGAGRRILLAEDIADIRHYLTDLLTGAGFTVTAAANGREALLCAGQSEVPLAAVITDQTMPEMDGWSLLSALRLRYDPALPVILLSATPAQPPEDWPVHMQFDASLLKPVDSGRLLGTLARLLKLSSQQADAAPARQPQSVLATTATISPGEMLLPNDARLKEFQTWAERGALSTLEVEATELAEKHPEYAAFACFVLTRARALDLKSLAAYCADARGTQAAS
jgi:signal transduction histidine kinase